MNRMTKAAILKAARRGGGQYERRLLDDFALKAPLVPDWFEPEMPEFPSRIVNRNTGEEISPDALTQSALDGLAAGAAFTRSKERASRRLIQWPYAWARMQLAERAKRTA